MGSGVIMPVAGLPGDFEALEALGHTMSSDLYLARCLRLCAEPVVVKVLRATADEDEHRLFVEGNDLAARYDHPNLIQVLDMGTFDDGRSWVAVPYLRRGSLADEPPATLDAVLHIGVRVADVLALLHAEGALHRDIKPANILLDEHGEPILTDLNVAGRLHEHTDSITTSRLTTSYAAPEVREFGRYTVRSELFALGATLLELTDDPPSALGELLTRMTALEPEHRPQNAPEVAAALRQLQRTLDLPTTDPTAPLRNTDGVSAHPHPTPSRTTGRSRRSLRIVFVSVALVGTLVAGGVWWFQAQPDSLPSTYSQPYFREDFDDPQLAAQRWEPPADPRYYSPGARELNMVVPSGVPQEVDTKLYPRGTGTFREIDFKFRVPDYTRHGTGGVFFVVGERGGRTHELFFGPKPGDYPLSVAALVCHRAMCSTYDDYEPPPTPPPEAARFTLGESVPATIVTDGSTIRFLIHGAEIAQTPASEPLETFRVDVQAESSEQWHVTVDAIRVYR